MVEAEGMSLLQVIVLALIQGITEFLPVSSSAHLILPGKLLNWPDQGLAFDTSVHVGTLLAVLLFYRKDLLAMTSNIFAFVFKRNSLNDYGKMFIYMCIGTIPVGLVGMLAKGFVETYLRSELVIACSTIVFGLVLLLAQMYNNKVIKNKSLALQNNNNDTINIDNNINKENDVNCGISIKNAIIIGFAQAIALIPGTSRSGITLTAGYFLGLKPEHAAKFSFLLSIPVIILSALLSIKDLVTDTVVSHELLTNMIISMCIGAILSFITAFFVIKIFLDYLTKLGLVPYVLYRIVLGAVLLAILYC